VSITTSNDGIIEVVKRPRCFASIEITRYITAIVDLKGGTFHEGHPKEGEAALGFESLFHCSMSREGNHLRGGMYFCRTVLSTNTHPIPPDF